jgi:hypothetical protein
MRFAGIRALTLPHWEKFNRIISNYKLTEPPEFLSSIPETQTSPAQQYNVKAEIGSKKIPFQRHTTRKTPIIIQSDSRLQGESCACAPAELKKN